MGLSSSARSVKVGKKVTLTASVVPTASAGGTVTFQRYNAGTKKWVNIIARTLAWSAGRSSATAVISWTPPLGTTQTRVIYAGGLLNVSTASGALTIKATR